MNILVINQPLSNRGDESAHRALIFSLLKSFPNASIKVLFLLKSESAVKALKVDERVKYININSRHSFFLNNLLETAVYYNFYKILTVIHPSLSKMRKEFKNADVIINAPGGICMGGFQNWQHIYQLLIAKQLHKKIIYYSRSIGPFPTVTAKNRKFKKLCIELLKEFDFLSLRDNKSMKIADELGLKYIPTVDTAFLTSPSENIIPYIPFGLSNQLYAVIVPNQLTWHFAFKDIPQQVIDSFYVSIIRTLLNDYPSFKFIMLPQLFAKSNGDYSYFKKLAEQISSDRIFVLKDDLNSDIQQSIINHAKFVIGARYHSIVFSINNATPFVSLTYEHKMSGLLSSLGLDNYSLDITNLRDIESAEIIKKECINKLSSVINKNIESYQIKAKNISQECYDAFLKRI